MKPYSALFSVLFFSLALFAKPITTNNIQFENAPDWLTEKRVEEATARIQSYLEWDLIRIKAYYYSDMSAYLKTAELTFPSNAFFRKQDGSIHLSPKVTNENFSRIFDHELVHAIFFQKYHASIPAWLEEGFANFIGTQSHPDYVWLSKQLAGPPATDVTKLVHPQTDKSGSRFHYEASTALIEMIASHCSLKDLLQLSVGSKLQTYLKTYCEIPDVNAEFRRWVRRKALPGPVTSKQHKP